MIAPHAKRGFDPPDLGFDLFPKVIERYELDSH